MNSPVHQQAMSKIASAITSLPAPSVTPPEREAEPGLRVALYHAPERDPKGEVHCHYVLKYPSGGITAKSKNRKQKKINTFPSGGMTDGEVASEVVIRAVDKIITAYVGIIKVYVEQDSLREKLVEALPLFPNLCLLEKDDFEGELLSQDARKQVTNRVREREQAHEKEHKLKRQGLLSSGVSLERTLYVDASCGLDREKIGYGYVIKDVIGNGSGRKVWHLTYGSGTATVHPRNGSTGAELKAIRNTLLTTGAIDKNIRSGQRSLTVYSDSLWGIRIINAKRRGTEP
jgi:hypothetical protein